MRILNIKLLIFLLIIQIILNVSMLESVEYISDYEKKIDKLWLKICENVAKKHSMQIVGMGGGMDNGKAHLLTISFEKTNKLNKLEARKLIVNCMIQILLEVNQSEELRVLLSNYPFNENNIEVSIYFKDKENSEILHPFQNTTWFSYGKINYTTLGKENKYQYKTQERESFEEALQKVQCNE